MEISRVGCVIGFLGLALTAPVLAQEGGLAVSPSRDSRSVSIADESACRPFQLQTASPLTLRQRACWYGDRLISGSTLFDGAFLSAFAQVRNSPRLEDDGWGDLGHRLGAFYARRAGQSGAELMAGYLHHEDPRPRLSGQHGFWNRTRGALMSVLITQDTEGNRRLALAPIAGSLGSGMVSVGCYRERNSMADGFGRAGLTYSTYFGSALLREFRPDVSGFASHLLHKKKQN